MMLMLSTDFVNGLNQFVVSCPGSGGADAKKGKTKEGKGAKKGGPEQPVDSSRPEPPEAVNPLVEVGVEEETDGRLVMPGNMTLVYLTLSCAYHTQTHTNIVAVATFLCSPCILSNKNTW